MMSPLTTTGTFDAAIMRRTAAVSQTPPYICLATRPCTARNLSGKSLTTGISRSSSSLPSTPSLAFIENLPGPIVSHPASSIFRSTSGVRSSPEPLPLLRTIGNGQPQFKSAGPYPAAFTRSRQRRSASGFLPMNCGVVMSAPSGPPRSSLSLRGSNPGSAAMNGVTASEKPASAISAANVSRKHRMVTPRSGARIRRVI